MKCSKRIFFRDGVFLVADNVYEPAEDTFLLAEHIKVKATDFVLDMGTGCGILAVLAAKKCKKVVAIDLNPHAIKCGKKNAELHCVEKNVEFRLGKLFQPVEADETFDLIMFNAPYLPTDPYEDGSWIGKAWAGGPEGRSVIDEFVTDVPRFLSMRGKVLLVQSSLSNIDLTLKKLDEVGLKTNIVAGVKIPFERLVLIEAKRNNQKMS